MFMPFYIVVIFSRSRRVLQQLVKEFDFNIRSRLDSAVIEHVLQQFFNCKVECFLTFLL